MNTHEEFRRRPEVRTSSDRSFGLVFATFFALIALWPVVRRHEFNRRWALVVCALFLFTALVQPGLLGPLNRLWTQLALVLNRISTPLIMGLFFFLVITPLALLFRLQGKDLLRLRFDPAASSYWIWRESTSLDPKSMTHQF
jgi:hypothetical protein